MELINWKRISLAGKILMYDYHTPNNVLVTALSTKAINVHRDVHLNNMHAGKTDERNTVDKKMNNTKCNYIFYFNFGSKQKQSLHFLLKAF